MATITEVVFASESDKALILANEEFVRPLTIGNNWSQIRVGLCYQIYADGSNISNATFLVGMCSGASFPVGAASTTGFIGANVTGNAALTGTAAIAGAAHRYYTAPMCTTSKVGASYVFGTAVAANQARALWPTDDAGGSNRRGCLFVDIIKGSPNFTIQLRVYSAVSIPPLDQDMNLTWLLSNMEQQAPTSAATLTHISVQTTSVFAAGTTDTHAYTETDPLNCVDIYWNRTTYPLWLYAVAASRLA